MGGLGNSPTADDTLWDYYMIELLENEEWRDIAGWDYYRISNMGRVLRKAGTPLCETERLLKPFPLSNGYLAVRLNMAGHRRDKILTIHRLTLLTFAGEPPSPIHQAAHNDGDKNNCRLDNLRWATPKENSDDKVKHGTASYARCDPVMQERNRLVLNMRRNGAKLREIAVVFDCCIASVHKILKKEAA